MRTKIKKMRNLLFLCAIFLGLTSWSLSVSAASQEEEFKAQLEKATVDNSQIGLVERNISTSTLGINNARIISQEGSDLKISFDLENKVGAQPQVRYAVVVFEQNNNAPIIYDRKVYEEEASVFMNKAVHRDIDYSAPSYLEGGYDIAIEARNESGLLLGRADLAKVYFNGNGVFASISKCELVEKKEETGDNNKNGFLASFVPNETNSLNIERDKQVHVRCDVSNNFKTETELVPVVAVYEYSAFGKQLSTNKNDAIRISSAKEMQYDFLIPALPAAKPYMAMLMFVDQSGAAVSNLKDLNLAVDGKSSSIGNLLLDKDGYEKGDNAKISFLWPYSSFVGFLGLHGKNFELDIMDASAHSCGQKIVQSLDKLSENNRGISMQSVDFAITDKCVDPRVRLAILEEDGSIADQQIYVVNTTSTTVEKGVVQENGEKIGSYMRSIAFKIFLTITIILVVAVIMLFIFKKNKNKGLTGVVILFFALGFGIVFSENAKASTVTDIYPDCYGSGTVNTTKQIYAPGEIISFYIDNLWSTCPNFAQVGVGAKIDGATGYFWTYANSAGITKTVASTIVVPSTPGSYDVKYTWGFGDQFFWTTDPITVAAASVNGVCGSAANQLPGPYPTTNLCAPGIAYGVSETATNWVWTCYGSGGGTNAACSTPKAAVSCTGIIPSGAQAHDAEESTGLSTSTPWVYSASDTVAKCQYRCSPGYNRVGSSCISACSTNCPTNCGYTGGTYCGGTLVCPPMPACACSPTYSYTCVDNTPDDICDGKTGTVSGTVQCVQAISNGCGSGTTISDSTMCISKNVACSAPSINCDSSSGSTTYGGYREVAP